MASLQERIDHFEKVLHNLATYTRVELTALRKDLDALLKSQFETAEKLRACQNASRDLKASSAAPTKSLLATRDTEPTLAARVDRGSSTRESMDYAEESRQMSREMNLAWGRFCDKWGSLGEDLLLRNLAPIVRTILNREITESAAFLTHRLPDGQVHTFYGIAASEDMVFLNNTVLHLECKDVDRLVQDIDDFPRCYPECRDKAIVGIVAGVTVDQSAVEYGEELGFLVLAGGVEPLEVQNRPGFEPKRW